MIMTNEPLVDVVMVTYNQEQYIAQAIESVLMQKTTFPFRLLIGEDCSTDETRFVCANYAKENPDQIKLILHNENQGLLKNYKSVLDSCTAKYIAILEGDDFWVDEFKLQDQVEILDKNENIGLVHTNCNLLYESEKIKLSGKYKGKTITENAFEEILKMNYIRPLTTCFRRVLYKEYVNIDDFIKNHFKTLDYPLWLSIAKHTHFYYIDKITAHYRIHEKSISHSNDYYKSVSFLQSTYKIKYYFSGNSKSIRNEYIINYMTLAMHFKKNRDVKRLRPFLKLSNTKSIILFVLSSNVYTIGLYRTINGLRQFLIKN